MTALEIEIKVARYFNSAVNLIVPNVSWGLVGGQECDMLVLTGSGYATEIEIKVSRSDLKRDAEKRHRKHPHLASDKIKKTYFAMPESMESCVDLVPKTSGVLLVKEGEPMYSDSRVTVFREAEIISKYKFTDQERSTLARLGTLRIWGLKEKLFQHGQQSLILK